MPSIKSKSPTLNKFVAFAQENGIDITQDLVDDFVVPRKNIVDKFVDYLDIDVDIIEKYNKIAGKRTSTKSRSKQGSGSETDPEYNLLGYVPFSFKELETKIGTTLETVSDPDFAFEWKIKFAKKTFILFGIEGTKGVRVASVKADYADLIKFVAHLDSL
jgi:hypothetical protein